jgi:hypothetical protein
MKKIQKQENNPDVARQLCLKLILQRQGNQNNINKKISRDNEIFIYFRIISEYGGNSVNAFNYDMDGILDEVQLYI